MRLTPEEEKNILKEIAREQEDEFKRREDSLKRILKKARNKGRV